MPPRRGLSRLLPRGRHTLGDVARELGGGPGPAALLGEYALRYGLDPLGAPASATVLPYMEQSFGVWYVDGGLRALADAVFARCGERGVEFRFDTPVRALERDGERVVGVRTDEGVLAADAVLSAVPGLGAAEPAAPAPGRFTVLLALDGARPAGTAHRTVVHAADGAAEARAVFADGVLPDRPTVQVLRPDDPSLVPGPDAEAAVLTVTVPARLALSAAEQDAYAGELLAHLAAMRPRPAPPAALAGDPTDRLRPAAFAGRRPPRPGQPARPRGPLPDRRARPPGRRAGPGRDVRLDHRRAARPGLTVRQYCCW